MNNARIGSRRTAFFGLGLLLLTLPACRGSSAWYPNQPDGSSRVAYKPPATSLSGRPFYVSGYGGADYSPERPRRMAPNCPVPPDTMVAPATAATRVSVSHGTWDEP